MKLWGQLGRGLSILIALSTVLAACGGSTHTLTGTLQLPFSDARSAYGFNKPSDLYGQSCHGLGGFSDIESGATVTVTNEVGKTIAVVPLSDGIYSVTTQAPDGFPQSCVFHFSAKVPTTSSYTVEVSHRGGLTYTPDQLSTQHWAVSLTLGGV